MGEDLFGESAPEDEQEADDEEEEGGAEVVTIHAPRIATGELHRVLHNVALFASDDEARPVLRCVRLSIEGQTLKATATDSYRLAEDEATIEGNGGGGPWLIDLHGERAGFLLKRLKGFRFAAEVEIDGDENGVTFVVPDFDGGGGLGEPERIRLKSVEGEFPNSAQLWPTEYGAVESVSANPSFLAEYAKVIDDNGDKSSPITVRFTGDAHKPFEIRRGRTFRGLLMPVRMPR